MPELEEHCNYIKILNSIFGENEVEVAEYKDGAPFMDVIVAANGYYPNIVIANGYGALPALILTQLKYRLPIILINPMYPPRYYLNEFRPNSPYNGFLCEQTYYKLCDKSEWTYTKMNLILGKYDDIIDTKRTKDYFGDEDRIAGAKIYFAEGGHFLEEENLKPLIRDIAYNIKNERKNKDIMNYD